MMYSASCMLLYIPSIQIIVMAIALVSTSASHSGHSNILCAILFVVTSSMMLPKMYCSSMIDRMPSAMNPPYTMIPAMISEVVGIVVCTI